MEINILKIADKNLLFAKYLQEASPVKEFYPHHFGGDWTNAIHERVSRDYPRAEMVKLLEEQNRNWGAPAEVFDNISRLQSQKSLAVVTGQQAGIFGGPLYTIYKIFSALKLAARLQKDHPGYDFVPLFWLEVDDNDFEEINHIQYFDKKGRFKKLEISAGPEDRLKSVYLRKIPGEISRWRQAFEEDCPETEFRTEVLDKFFSIYREGVSYADAFARLLLELFGHSGLVVLNPALAGFKQLAKATFRRALKSPGELLARLSNQTERLKQAGFPQQIRFRPGQTLLFLTDEKDRRLRLDFREDGTFLLGGMSTGRTYNAGEIGKLLESAPERFSPNVALRPVVQDDVLPTIAYVAGPAEIAYLAQAAALYPYFDLPMPVVFPRHRITILENKIQKIINKLNLSLSDLFGQRSEIINQFIKQDEQNIFGNIQTIETEINRQLRQLESIVSQFDPTLLNPVKKTDQKMKATLQQLLGKVTNAIKEKEQVKIRQIEKVVSQLFPGDEFQEREINIVFFLIKYGPDFIDELYSSLPDNTTDHIVVNI